MKILQILPELNLGGVETGTVDLAKRLVGLGHQVLVVSHGGELVKELEASGARHYELPAHKKSLFSIISCIGRLTQIIRSERPDVVHARSRVPAWIAYFACRKTQTALVTTCHGYYRKHFFSYPMGWAKRVIVLSNVIARHMIDDFDVPHERIVLIPRSVDMERFKYVSPQDKRKEEFNVGIVGRITPLKGHLHFVKAMARIARQVPQLKVWIVGDAPGSKQAYKEEVEILVRRLGLWHSTQFLGRQRDMPAVMQQLDALVLATTTQEAFGRVIIEAQAAGVPVVATRVGGVVDIITDGHNGLLVPPADPKAIAEALMGIYKDVKFASLLAENAYKKAKEKYTLELMVKRTLQVYEDALRNFKILLIKFSSLGDIVLSSAAIRAVKEKLGANHKLTVLTSIEGKDILLGCPYIDELLVCDFKNKDKGPKGFFKLARNLRRGNFDLVLDLQNNRRSHLLGFLSLAEARYGYRNRKLGFLLNRGLKEDGTVLEPLAHQFRLLKLLGIEPSGQIRLEMWPAEADERYIEEFLSGQWLSPQQKLVGINISASKKWPSKNWPLRHIAALCEELSRRQLRPVITGTESDLAASQELITMLKNAKPINACGKTTLNQLACLCRRCNVYVTPDSAPLHIAVSQDVAVVALFGPTDYRRHLHPAARSTVLKKDLPCSPCYKARCKDAKCMQLIAPQEVLQAIVQLL
jgi:lipopolysaccharide heptosyltransferase II